MNLACWLQWWRRQFWIAEKRRARAVDSGRTGRSCRTSAPRRAIARLAGFGWKSRENRPPRSRSVLHRDRGPLRQKALLSSRASLRGEKSRFVGAVRAKSRQSAPIGVKSRQKSRLALRPRREVDSDKKVNPIETLFLSHEGDSLGCTSASQKHETQFPSH